MTPTNHFITFVQSSNCSRLGIGLVKLLKYIFVKCELYTRKTRAVELKLSRVRGRVNKDKSFYSCTLACTSFVLARHKANQGSSQKFSKFFFWLECILYDAQYCTALHSTIFFLLTVNSGQEQEIE